MTNPARTRAGKHAAKHRARFGMPAQRFHCTQDHLDGAAAQLASDITLVEALRDKYKLEGKWRTLDRAVAALRAQQEQVKP